jgi:HEAT repeat protein
MSFSTVINRMKMMSSDTAVRVLAVRQLGMAGAVDTLERALHDSSRAVRVAAADALSDLGDAGFEVLGEALHRGDDVEVRHVVASELARSNHRSVVGHLIMALEDTDDTVFSAVCDALESKRANAAVPSLHHVLRTGSVDRRCRVIASLMAIPDVRSVRPLVEALDHEDGRVRSLAAKALGVFGNAQQVADMCQSIETHIEEEVLEAPTDQVAAQRYTRRLRIQRLHDFS